jgi:ketosteroid isomerase-like protein
MPRPRVEALDQPLAAAMGSGPMGIGSREVELDVRRRVCQHRREITLEQALQEAEPHRAMLDATPRAADTDRAMSQDNVDVVRRVFGMVRESLRRGDPGSSFDEWIRKGLIAPGLEWRAGTRAGMGVAGIDDFAGRDGYVEFTRRWTEDFEDLAIEPEQIIDADSDRVVATTHTHGTGKGSGATVDMRTAWVVTLEAGRIVDVVLFLEPNDALKAVGLRE